MQDRSAAGVALCYCAKTVVVTGEVSVPLACTGRETLLDEDLDEGQVEEELAPLTVQLAYAAARLGGSAEAISAYEVRAPGVWLAPSAPCQAGMGEGSPGAQSVGTNMSRWTAHGGSCMPLYKGAQGQQRG